MASQIRPFLTRVARYFVAYGGWAAVFGSPLFFIAVVISIVNYRNWVDDHWSSLTQSLLPNLLGFTLGTYAILFSLMTNRLKRALRAIKNTKGVSYLDEINATFLHFITIQVVAILWSMLYRSTLVYDILSFNAAIEPLEMPGFNFLHAAGGLLGFILLSYSVCLIVGAALAVYRIASIIDPSD